ncbi:MAG TPA: Ig-like domain-containing protein [Gemmatimonadales bacterium]|nr:Ig-like domain-containing protein [Gemmatimonadales bacterium]
MRRALALLLPLAVAGCSGLDEGEAGVVGIEVQVPGPDSLEVGESIQLGAKPLDKNGDSAAVAVTWVSLDPTATIDPATGVLTGVSVGTARVQATVAALGSNLITFAVVPRADTLAISGDSIFTASVTAEALPDFTTVLSSFNPAGPVPSHGVVFAITSPDPLTTTPALVLTGNSQVADTVPTGPDGTAVTALKVLAGATPPDSVIVTVSATRIRGAVVPGSGQRFILRLTP